MDGVSYPAIGAVIALLALWSGMLLAAIKMLLDRSHSHFAERFKTLEGRQDKLSLEIDGLRNEVKSECVHRPDWIRMAGSMGAKLDVLRSDIQAITEQAHARY